MKKTGFFAGSFDPFHKGHLSIVCESLAVFDKVIIGIGKSSHKAPLFTPLEREEIIHSSLQDFVESYNYKSLNGAKFSKAEADAIKKLKDKVEIVLYDGLTVDAALSNGADKLIRGYRTEADYEFESQLIKVNQDILNVRKENIGTELIKSPREDLDGVSSSRCKYFCDMGEYIVAQNYLSKSAHNMMVEKYLVKEFIELGKSLGTSEKEAKTFYNKLVHSYNDNRHHHNLSHLAYCLNYVNLYHTRVKQVPNVDILKVAVFCHDIVNTGKADDEELSLKEGLKFIKKASPKDKDLFAKCIMATKHTKQAPLLTLEEKLISDVDVAILGDNVNYPKYSQHIRQEYSHFSDSVYAKGRAKVLSALLKTPNLYKTDYFAKHFNDDAQNNMQKELFFWNSFNSKTVKKERD